MMRACPKPGCGRPLEPGEELCPSCQSEENRKEKGVWEAVVAGGTLIVGVLVWIATGGGRGKGT